MFTKENLEELSHNELKDLVKSNDLSIPQYATSEDLIDILLAYYKEQEAELDTNPETTPEESTPSIVSEQLTGSAPFGKYASKQAYIEAMLQPVLCIISPISTEFSRQDVPTCSISVGNSVIPNREFAFVADGSTVTSVPRIAINRIKEMKTLTRGTQKLNRQTMKNSLEGSKFGSRFRVYELNAEEIAEYQANKKATAKAKAASGVGLD